MQKLSLDEVKAGMILAKDVVLRMDEFCSLKDLP